MPKDKFYLFSATNAALWSEAAKKELKGKDPFESLSISKQGLSIKPYYDASDTDSLAETTLSCSTNPFLGPRGWYNTPIVTVVNDEHANKTALAHLNMGADGIIYRAKGPVRIEKLLDNIKLPYCSTFFLIDTNQSNTIYEFGKYVNTKGFDKAQIVGGVFCESSSAELVDLTQAFDGWGKFKALGNIIAHDPDPTTEISNALTIGVNTISKSEETGRNIKDIFDHIAFSFTIGPDFFLEIAKLKSFRRLWSQVQAAYHIPIKNSSVLLHGYSACWNNEKYQPNSNMLKSTTAALSAILGGCNAITIEPEDLSSPLLSRISRNVLTVLGEESHLNMTADPTAGSYYLESLIDQISKSAWEKFQNKIAQ